MTKTEIDKGIEAAKELIKKQQAEVTKAEKAIKRGWATTGSYPISDNKTINIITANETGIIQIMRHLLLHESFHKKALAELNLPAAPFEVDGHDISKWKEDLECRLAKITIKAKQEKLARLEARVKDLMSEEQKRAAKLSEIMDELGQA